ncbi:MAG: hypothetical protein GC129_00775 [Proteobacteria bacterium]|nr:hypothetical protein [Pseudomonadota bacterium]
MKPMSTRQHKVAREVQHLAAAALLQGRVHSTLPVHRLTVVGCWVSGDLRQARLQLTFPPEWDPAQTLAAANAQIAKPLRQYLAKNLATKSIPALTFVAAEETSPLL